MNYNNICDTSFIHPQSPPVPAQHPSLDIHIETHDPRRRTTSGSSSLAKAPDRLLSGNIGGMAGVPNHNGKQLSGFDQTKVLAPRARAKLDLDKKVMLSDYSISSIVLNKNISSSEPIQHSSLGIQRQINHAKNTEFNPISEISKYMVRCQEGLKNIHSKVTAKSLNCKRTGADQYFNLNRIDGEEKQFDLPKSQIPVNKLRTIPRAKKSTSQSWLEALECKPDIQSFSSKPLEVDTISLPFPQILDNPFIPGIGNPCISISSFQVNFEDSYRWTLYENIVTPDDI